jgi:hypothetical protein
MNEVIQIISGNIFDNKDLNIPQNFKVVNNLNEAKIYCFQQYELDTVWTDLKENKSLSLEFATEDDEDYWAENCSEKIEKSLSNTIYYEFIDEIDSDLFNCYINKKYNVNDNFWNMIFDVYRTKLMPCGWNGKFPSGNLVVFIPN